MLMESYYLLMFCASIYLQIFVCKFSFAADTITSIHSIKDDNISTRLVSSGQTFELGFFSPGKSKNRYVGIWYKTNPDVVVWVANRNNPLTESCGELTINNNGNLILLDREKTVMWSSILSMSEVNAVAQLLDIGNLVLRKRRHKSSDSYLWQSFDYPTDTLLAGMKLGCDMRTGLERSLTSWKSVDDPSDGNFTCRMDINGLPQVICSMGLVRKLRVGPWNGDVLSGYTVRYIPVYKPVTVFTENESYIMFESDMSLPITISTLNYQGQIQRLMFQNDTNKWSSLYSMPYDPCDNYGYCGNNGICKVEGDPICQCLEGFSPTSQAEWEILDWSKGCVRKTPLDCNKGDGFVKLSGVKVPDLFHFWLNKSMSLEECKSECLNNCSCVAYANSDLRGRGFGCLIWSGNLTDIRELRVKGSVQDIYVRLPSSGIKSSGDERKRKGLKIKMAASISSVICMFILLLLCITWRLRKLARGKGIPDEIELPLINLATIKTATRNFSPENILGEGGFGPVYRGNLSTGQEIAVKRLSMNSAQGQKEFKNEVELIAKLQHKNLVSLLGCCIHGDERILIYEYMPHKSLDHFIFDEKRGNTLSWKTRFDIVMGIARGILYLHQDSKLQIIHRDLKASNILLDRNLNPKISDFGLARIFRGDEKENRTKNIVGTYGYISPEYAIDGKYSVKSDVFSFGVLLLEIVSGKRNRRFSHPDHYHNLLGHAWSLWKQGKALELMAVCFKESCVKSQVLRCIHVGLLCVQKCPKNRPMMNSVLMMLANEGAKLPYPKEPGFFTERSSDNSCETSISRNEECPSRNRVTITLYAR